MDYSTEGATLQVSTKNSITSRVNEGYSLVDIKEMCGHADIKSTLKYGKYGTDRLGEVMRGKPFTENSASIHTCENQDSSIKSKKKVAGVGGFEPPNPGSKDLCLTA